MMTPEQQDSIRAELRKFGGEWWTGVATPRIIALVNDLLAAERAAERERCVAIIDASCVINEAQAVALIAAIRAQGDGK